mmetsp:Transcript_32202/g.44165  ORF Transcript_32202/g.44165 Transcript_32202/m.44165 type:complete len:348 (+) Transcript_32202:571-1614(+)
MNEKDSFVLELTYNYGVESYTNCNALRFLSVDERFFCGPTALTAGELLLSPDGYRFKLVPPLIASPSCGPIVGVSLYVSQLQQSLRFYREVLGGRWVAGEGELSACRSFSSPVLLLELVQSSGILSGGGGVGLVVETIGGTMSAVLAAAGPQAVLQDPDGLQLRLVDSHNSSLETSSPAPQEAAVLVNEEQQVPELSADQVSRLLDSSGPLLLEVFAPWCPTCQKILPLLREAALQLAPLGVAVAKLDGSVSPQEELHPELQAALEYCRATGYPSVFLCAGGGCSHFDLHWQLLPLLRWVGSRLGLQETLWEGRGLTETSERLRTELKASGVPVDDDDEDDCDSCSL